jgi:hypothetical protein
MDPVKLKIDGRPNSFATRMVLFGGATIGTAMAFVGDRILKPHRTSIPATTWPA